MIMPAMGFCGISAEMDGADPARRLGADRFVNERLFGDRRALDIVNTAQYNQIQWIIHNTTEDM
jgi:hypothetical protein